MNRTPSRVLDWRTPYELMYGRKPDVSRLRIFACPGVGKRFRPGAKKLQRVNEKCIMLGYTENPAVHQVRWTNDNTIGTARTVVFDETGFLDARHTERVGDHIGPVSSTVRTARARHVPRNFDDIGRFRKQKERYDAYFKELSSLKTIGDFAVVPRPASVQVFPLAELFTVK